MARHCVSRRAELMEPHEYVRRLLDAYRTTPGTCGAVRRPDRLLAAQLHPLAAVTVTAPVPPCSAKDWLLGVSV